MCERTKYEHGLQQFLFNCCIILLLETSIKSRIIEYKAYGAV